MPARLLSGAAFPTLRFTTSTFHAGGRHITNHAKARTSHACPANSGTLVTPSLGSDGPSPLALNLALMGALCSTDKEENPGQHEKETQQQLFPLSQTLSHIHHKVSTMVTNGAGVSHDDSASKPRGPWDSILDFKPSREEIHADRKLQNARNNDIANIFEPAPPLAGFQNQEHPRRPNDHFLLNVDLINGARRTARDARNAKRYGKDARAPLRKERRVTNDDFYKAELEHQKSQLLQIMERMPKGGHLHVHFNATLNPGFLLTHAEGEELMCISSDKPLRDVQSFGTCEIQFLLVAQEKQQSNSMFAALTLEESRLLKDSSAVRERLRMPYSAFRLQWEAIKASFEDGVSFKQFKKDSKRFKDVNGFFKTEEEWRALEPVMHMTWKQWLISKLVFHAEEVHNPTQDQDGAWAKFNGRTRMMKGLFNYESAYRAYTLECLKQFDRENVQYAEIRPNFMRTNQIFKINPTTQELTTLENEATMQIIVDVCNAYFENDNEQERPRTLKRVKVIYCTPRSFTRFEIQNALDECFRFKKRWPEYIAGFDLVGEESKGRPLSDFTVEMNDFQCRCEREGVKIPFLLHCGETDDDPDNNLENALYDLKNIERLGHGFALLSKPYLKDQVIRKGICIESCPISNEILGLSSHPSKHAIYGLLASEYHCTLNSDNATLFRSTLAHDFYQFLVGRGKGSQTMTLHVCRQLIQWSIQHACLEPKERDEVLKEWTHQWELFIDWVNTIPEFKTAKETVADRKAKEAEEKWEARNNQLWHEWEDTMTQQHGSMANVPEREMLNRLR